MKALKSSLVAGCEVSSWLEIMSKTLTDEQAEILRFASGGHNLLITGQATAGKSTVVNSIRQDCLKVAVVCSSGIACKVYENGVAATVHLYY